MTRLEVAGEYTRIPVRTDDRWVHVCNGLDPRRDGGMVPSILGMTGGLAGQGGAVRIVTPNPSRLEGVAVPLGVRLEGPEIGLEGVVRGADAVHVHGLWQGHGRRAARAAQSARVPYLVAAHGMADPWALRQKRLKKWIYSALVETRNLRGAACLHALTRPEVRALRAMAPGRPVALVPNGVDLAALDDLPPRSAIEAEMPQLCGKFVLLFFGRVHKKKGLDLLAPALAKVARDHPGIHLLVAGFDDGALSPLLDAAKALAIGDRVSYVGHVSGETARRAWGAADAFVLPSHSEGFSMAVLEALAARLPVVVTTACNFPELDRADGGIVVQPTVNDLERGLRGLMERSPAQRRAMAARGRKLVAERFTWEQQARRLAEVYRWLAGSGPIPEAVALAEEA